MRIPAGGKNNGTLQMGSKMVGAPAQECSCSRAEWGDANLHVLLPVKHNLVQTPSTRDAPASRSNYASRADIITRAGIIANTSLFTGCNLPIIAVITYYILHARNCTAHAIFNLASYFWTTAPSAPPPPVPSSSPTMSPPSSAPRLTPQFCFNQTALRGLATHPFIYQLTN